MKTAVYASQVFLPEEIVENAYVVYEDGIFQEVTKKKPEGIEIIDREGKIVTPGLMDTHIHGFDSYDAMDVSWEALSAISRGLLRAGVTSFLPTTLTADHNDLKEVCVIVGEHKDDFPGAKSQGIMFEGPYFTEEHKGAQNPKYMGDPDIEEVKGWYEASKGTLLKMAIAPERNGAADFIKEAVDLGLHISIGHSNATYEQARACLDAGATIINHTYNGMSGLHHRNPGMVGAALSADHVYAELICDGHHVHPKAAEVVLRARGTEETVLITDSMRAAGLPEGGKSQLGEFPVTIKDGTARLDDGTLAGSILLLKTAVKNVIDWGIATPLEAVRMASFNPAKSVGKEDVCGQIKEGLAADFLVWDKDFNLEETYVDGERLYSEAEGYAEKLK